MRLIDYFDCGADLFPGRDCLHDGMRGSTYCSVRAITHRIANGLRAAGLGAGDKVAVYSPNHAMAYAALPRGPVGKVLKKDLRAPCWADRARKV